MELSIIIVSYNVKELLEKCMESITNSFKVSKFQSFKIEVIVVDNGSTDRSVEYLKSIVGTTGITSITGRTKVGAQHVAPDGIKREKINIGIRLIENKENVGFAKAVNQGIKQAEGETILLLNPDTQIKNGALEKLLEFEEKVRPAIIGAKLLNPDGSIQPSVFYLPTVKRAILEYWLGKKGEFSKFAPKGDEPVTVEAVVGGAMMISKEVIRKIGVLDERYFMYFEDLDYCRRAKKAKIKVWYFPSAEVVHEHGASGRNLASSKDQWKRLIPSSKVYHGYLRHYLISFIIWSGEKLKKR